MNFLNIFEDRISGIFGAARAPFSFKKLARQAGHEMEEETLVINGANTAPALYTVLVSANDDLILTQYYSQLTREISELVKAQAEKKHYSFVGEPLVRFMVDPELKPGRFSVFAENVDAPTLARLYEEERAYVSASRVDSASDRINNNAVPVSKSSSSYKASSAPSTNAVNSFNANMAQAQAIPPTVSRDMLAGMGGAAASAAIESSDARSQHLNLDPLATPRTLSTLVDVSSHKVYDVTSARCIIGRERGVADIALRDPNVSRRHAELSYTNGAWSIEDLNSTNGTSVNNRRVDRSPLIAGDTITLGLTTLEFRG